MQINDSLSICEFLAESNPHLNLWPSDPKLRALARSAAAEMHSGFTTIRNTYHTNFIAQYTGNIPVPEQARKEIMRILTIWDNARKVTKARLAELGEKDEGFLFGGFSIADAFFWPVLWVNDPIHLPINDYEKRITDDRQRFRTYNLALDSATPDALKWMATMWNDPSIKKIVGNYYRQAERPETRIERYENIFADREDIHSSIFPEDWKFSEPRSA
jgi:glutathione S-transferase